MVMIRMLIYHLCQSLVTSSSVTENLTELFYALQESDVMRSKLQAAKQKKLTLAAEVRYAFLF